MNQMKMKARQKIRDKVLSLFLVHFKPNLPTYTDYIYIFYYFLFMKYILVLQRTLSDLEVVALAGKGGSQFPPEKEVLLQMIPGVDQKVIQALIGS
jgi:hypothetical protein